MTNSIRANLNPHTIITNIKLLLSSDIKKEKSCIVVEGQDDWKFLRKFTSENVVFYESYSGNNGVKNILQDQRIADNRVIGICDKDYSSNTSQNRIFFYDFSCLEMMILKDDLTYRTVCCEFYNGNLPLDKLRDSIFKSLLAVSLLRKKNEENNYGLRLENLPVPRLLDGLETFNWQEFIFFIKQRGAENRINIADVIQELVQQVDSCNNYALDDFLNITNGHDYMAAFQYACNSHCVRQYKESEISSAFRVAYTKASLENTLLYENILQYGKNSNINIWN